MNVIKLFDYQEDMKERIEKALRLHRSVMAQMPTGTGKTVLLASVVESFLREHSNCNVWIVAHRRELVSQIRETIERVFSKTPSLLYKDFSNHPVNSSKITPSLFTLKEGSTSHPDPLTLRGEGGNRPTRCSEPLRSKVGGPSKVSPDCLSASAFNVPIKAVSIQWLSKHYDEIEEEPGMIVIDEAHHALAKTYKEMWERFPNAKFLGLTATPCRLNGKGFTDLFDVLVQSWSVPEFISKGRLATYDFVSIKSDGVTQRLIDSLQKRGADGDYQNKEMDMLLNKKPSIERLYRSLEEYGKDRKGIVYAINISHANAIAEFYREHGIAAVAIDSKTPSSLRKELIERFKASSNTSQNLPFSNHPVNSSKITPSLFTIKEGSTSHPDPLTLRGEGGNRPTRCSEPLRSKDGGPSKVSPDSAGWDRRDAIGDMTSATATALSSFAANSSAAIDRVQKELKELGLWKFAEGIMYIMQEVFGMPASRLIVPPNEKYGKFVLNEVLEAGNFGKHDARNRFGRSQLGHNLQRVYRDIRLVRYFPAEALCEPLFRIWHFFWRLKYKK